MQKKIKRKRKLKELIKMESNAKKVNLDVKKLWMKKVMMILLKPEGKGTQKMLNLKVMEVVHSKKLMLKNKKKLVKRLKNNKKMDKRLLKNRIKELKPKRLQKKQDVTLNVKPMLKEKDAFKEKLKLGKSKSVIRMNLKNN